MPDELVAPMDDERLNAIERAAIAGTRVLQVDVRDLVREVRRLRRHIPLTETEFLARHAHVKLLADEAEAFGADAESEAYWRAMEIFETGDCTELVQLAQFNAANAKPGT